MIVFNHALQHNMGDNLAFDQKMQILTKWADTPTDEGFTAILFASYHGNLNVIKFLIE